LLEDDCKEDCWLLLLLLAELIFLESLGIWPPLIVSISPSRAFPLAASVVLPCLGLDWSRVAYSSPPDPRPLEDLELHDMLDNVCWVRLL
jgi:hypothetical protein